MAQFAKVWAVKSPIRMAEGDTMEVALKRGGVKVVKLGAFLYAKNEQYYYASPLKTDDAD
jgi:hypothetical protein